MKVLSYLDEDNLEEESEQEIERKQKSINYHKITSLWNSKNEYEFSRCIRHIWWWKWLYSCTLWRSNLILIKYLKITIILTSQITYANIHIAF